MWGVLQRVLRLCRARIEGGCTDESRVNLDRPPLDTSETAEPSRLEALPVTRAFRARAARRLESIDQSAQVQGHLRLDRYGRARGRTGTA